MDWKKLHYVKTDLIKCGLSIPIRHEHLYRVVDGDWNGRVVPIENFDVYKETVSLLRDKEDILLYEYLKDDIEERKTRTERLVKFFEEIKQNGYKSQYELSNEKVFLKEQMDDEIVVAIDPQGHLVVINGWHRISMVKILGIKEIPVIVGIRHKEWVDFCNDFTSFTKIWKNEIQDVYHPIEHLDFKHLKPMWGEQRYNIIKDSMSVKEGTLLDVGAHLGFFCHRFEEDGFECTALENHEPYLKYLEKFKEANYRNFKIDNRSIFDLKSYSFDVILCMNILHHFLKSKNEYEQLIRLLSKINTRELYIQIPSDDETQMKNVYVNYNQVDFLNLISEQTKMKYIQIGIERQRPIFKFTRE